jgi:hypothetical protein
MKTVIVVFSDPKSGSDEALGRLFNALFLTLELKEKKQDVTLIFQGAGTRWIAEASKSDHPTHAIYAAVKDKVLVCGGCADVFGATAQAESAGARLVRDKQIPGTPGVLDLSRYLDENARLITF